MILGSVWKHQRTINSCYGVKFCDFGPNRGLGIFITDMIILVFSLYRERIGFEHTFTIEMRNWFAMLFFFS